MQGPLVAYQSGDTHMSEISNDLGSSKSKSNHVNSCLWRLPQENRTHFFVVVAFPACTKPPENENFHFIPWKLWPWWDLRKQTLSFAIKDERRTSKDVGYYCFDVIRWYFFAKKSQKQLDRRCRTCSAGSLTSTKLHNEPAQHVSPCPSVPAFAFESKNVSFTT